MNIVKQESYHVILKICFTWLTDIVILINCHIVISVAISFPACLRQSQPAKQPAARPQISASAQEILLLALEPKVTRETNLICS